MSDPVAYFAFSYDTTNELPAVKAELGNMTRLFLGQQIPFQHSWQVGGDDIKNIVNLYGKGFKIFHFSGHASPATLQANAYKETTENLFAEGVADYICAQCQNLQLVFLNACATQEQAAFFWKKGVPIVIASTRPIGDAVACAFAYQFYDHFIKLKKPLAEAFALALPATKIWYDTQKDRGSFDLEPEDGPLYQLHLNPAADCQALENTSFDQWLESLPANSHTPLVERPEDIASKGLHENCYLLCDRVKPQEILCEHVLAKTQGLRPVPFFLVVHEHKKHCPDYVAQWLRYYGLSTLFEKDGQKQAAMRESGFFYDVPLPQPELFGDLNWDDPANAQAGRYKDALRDLYLERFEKKASAFNRRPPDKYPLIVVHHQLEPSAWNRSDIRKSNIEALLRYYLDAFSTELQRDFSERLLVLFSVKYNWPDTFFPALFDTLENAFGPLRIAQLKSLDDIFDNEVDEWKKRVFDDHNRPNPWYDIYNIFTEPPPLPMEKIAPKLAEEVIRYNTKIIQGRP